MASPFALDSVVPMAFRWVNFASLLWASLFWACFGLAPGTLMVAVLLHFLGSRLAHWTYSEGRVVLDSQSLEKGGFVFLCTCVFVRVMLSARSVTLRARMRCSRLSYFCVRRSHGSACTRAPCANFDLVWSHVGLWVGGWALVPLLSNLDSVRSRNAFACFAQLHCYTCMLRSAALLYLASFAHVRCSSCTLLEFHG